MSGQAAGTLKLLAVTHYPPMAGGSAQSCALLWRGIARRGHCVHAHASITPGTRDFDRRQQADRPAAMTISRYELPYFHLKLSDFDEYLRYQAIEHDEIRRTLPALIDRYRPDVVVSGHETLAGAVIDPAHAKGLPCALLLRGSPTWQIVTGVYPERLTARYLELFRRADVVIAVGDYMRTRLAGLGVPGVVHIPNFLDLEMFSPGPRDPDLAARYGIDADRVVVLHASVMTPRKRPEDVLRSAALTLPRAPKLVYLFLGGEERASELEEACRREGLADRVRFIARVPYEKMPDHIRLADMVVLASEGEGLARVYLEAQAGGRMPIASDIPAAREVIEDGETGLLFKVGDAAGLAARIMEAYGNTPLRERIGQAARRRVAQHEIGRVIDNYIETLSALAGEKSG
ncbi:MAG: glycosyltransferase family 4 protein [Bryobacteraceae bacterium]|nr:glycosyltransferase family 4 protein [Bryobacteraceae bacterium]